MSELDDMLGDLLDDEDLTEEEALALIRLRLRLGKKGQALARRSGSGLVNGIAFPSAANSPASVGSNRSQEREEWEERERVTQGGAFTPGGATAGGIFGDSAIPFDNYDPGSGGRAAPIQHAETNERMVALLERAEKRELASAARIQELEARELERQRELKEGDRPSRGHRRLGPGRKWGR